MSINQWQLIGKIFYVNGDDKAYFESFGNEHIPKK